MDEFDQWNLLKKKIEQTEYVKKFPQEGEVWMIVFGKNIGLEQNGGKDFVRPGLIVKKFNNQMFWVVPLSRKQKTLDFYYNFVDPYHLKSSVVLAQLKLISAKRAERKLYEFDKVLFETVREKIKDFL